MHRFFLPNALLTEEGTADLSPLRHQLRNVLRARAGDRIVLFDGSGYEYVTVLGPFDAGQVVGQVVDKRRASGEPSVHLTLFQCALKADKMEWVLQKGSELGVSRFVPVISERTIVRPAAALGGKYDRWRAIVREAAEQSGRGRLPEIAAPALYREAVAQGDGICLLPWEEAAGVPGLARRLLHVDGEAQRPLRISVMVGPEGGLSAAEAQAAAAAGWELVTLGPRILRAETAALAAVALALAALGEMGPPGTQDVCPPTAARV